MAEYAMSVKCGDKTYNISVSGKDVYFSSNTKTGGITLKGIKNYNNELRSTSDNKPVSKFELCQAIQRSLK